MSGGTGCDELLKPAVGALRGAFEGVEVDSHQTESLAEAGGPLPVVKERPDVIALQIDSRCTIENPAKVLGQVVDALLVVMALTMG